MLKNLGKNDAAMINHILEAYELRRSELEIKPFGTGLINNTWRVSFASGDYILQRINNEVFKSPEDIAHNIHLIGQSLREKHPEYNFIAPVRTLDGRELLHYEQFGFFRLFPFVENSHTLDVVQFPRQAFEAASQFGRFTRLLSDIDASQLKITIPHFHDLSLRYQQFLTTLQKGNRQRIQKSQSVIDRLLAFADVVEVYEGIQKDKGFKLRVTHHDTKISNVLFDSRDNGLCVIDLDTVMPGYFISDVGDMMRTYLPPVSEEEGDFEKIAVRQEIYEAIVRGYYQEMKNELTEVEKRHFFYSGKFIIYMQALRFMTDHLNDDVYYGARYEGHNLVRANNQLVLLERLMEREAVFMHDTLVIMGDSKIHYEKKLA